MVGGVVGARGVRGEGWVWSVVEMEAFVGGWIEVEQRTFLRIRMIMERKRSMVLTARGNWVWEMVGGTS